MLESSPQATSAAGFFMPPAQQQQQTHPTTAPQHRHSPPLSSGDGPGGGTPGDPQQQAAVSSSGVASPAGGYGGGGWTGAVASGGHSVGAMQPHDHCCFGPTKPCFSDPQFHEGVEVPPSACDNTTLALAVVFVLSLVGFCIIAATEQPLAATIAPSASGGLAVHQTICSHITDDLTIAVCQGNTTMGLQTQGASLCVLAPAVGYFIGSPQRVCVQDYFSPGFIQAQASALQNYLCVLYLCVAVAVAYGLLLAVRHNDNREARMRIPTHQQSSACCVDPIAMAAASSGVHSGAGGSQAIVTAESIPPSAFPILFHDTPQYASFQQLWVICGAVGLLWGLSIWYPLFELLPLWKKYSTGELASYFASLQVRFFAGTFALIPIVTLPFLSECLFKPLAWCMCVVPWCVYRTVGDTRVQSRPPGVPGPLTSGENEPRPFGKPENDAPCCIAVDNFFVNNYCCRRGLQSVQESVLQQQQSQLPQAPGPAAMDPMQQRVVKGAERGDSVAPADNRQVRVSRSFVMSDDGDEGTDTENDDERRRRRARKREKKEKRERERASRSTPIMGITATTSSATFGAARSSTGFSDADVGLAKEEDDIVNTETFGDVQELQRKEKKDKKEKKEKKEKRDKREKKYRD